ncbi:MAG: redoxin domain-containing protein [Nitrospinota bacterium]|nr:redoxin domain-containing protein [Nitrospinota bacterium]
MEAEFQFGRMHDWGIGAEQDYGEAAYWYGKSAGKGYPKAQLALGKLYENGKGVEKDRSRAESLYIKANAYVELLNLRGEGAIPSTGLESTAMPAGEGVVLPELSFITLDGRSEELSSLAGKWVILNFWATWCPPCKKEMPSLESFLQEKGDKDVVVVLVSIDRSPEMVRDFVGKIGIRETIYHDPEMKLGEKFMLDAVPTTFVINPGGRLVAYAKGYRDWMDPVVKIYMEKLITKANRK